LSFSSLKSKTEFIGRIIIDPSKGSQTRRP
jgi:hypothetical protein